MGIVIILKRVVINVVKETRSGSVPNWMANIVVLAAAGIAACMINTSFNSVDIGKNETIKIAIIGDITIRMKVTHDTKR